MRRVVVVAVIGCGRVAFDPAPSLGDGGTSDTGAGADATCTWSPFSVPTRLQGPILSTFDDWTAAPTLDETVLYFHSYRAADSDLYVATRPTPTDQFAAPTLVTELSTATSQWTPTLTEDGLILVFADSELGPFHLKVATRDNPSDMFGAPIDVPVIGGTPAQQDKSPWLSADGLRIMFTSNRGGSDALWESTRSARTSDFAPPTQLALGSGDALDNTLSADGLELYFMSHRSPSAMLDVWTARRTAVDQPFSAPELVPELSSARDETGLRLSLDGRTMYLNYDTLTAGGGQADIYTATRTCQ